jgi:hypothetical protein
VLFFFPLIGVLLYMDFEAPGVAKVYRTINLSVNSRCSSFSAFHMIISRQFGTRASFGLGTTSESEMIVRMPPSIATQRDARFFEL